MDYFRISVLIVTYKQQDVIGRTIDSIIQQKEYGLNEIVICDDCSPDNNWEVISEYMRKYPKIIRPYRNEKNLGIYNNSNKLVTLRGDSDLFCWLEGDDALCDGFFAEAQRFINKSNIDITEEIGIFSDFLSISPDGKQLVVKNKYIAKGRNPFGAYMRGLVSWRASLFSSSVINQFTPTITDQGLSLAESMFDSQWFRYVRKTFYLPNVSSIYYSGIGVSTNLSDLNSAYRTNEALIQWEYYLNHFVNNKQDKFWVKSRILLVKYLISPSLSLLIKFTYNYLIGIIPYGFILRKFRNEVILMLKVYLHKNENNLTA
ncbi:MAG: glycosyltransferase family 2 protein [Bacteroidales bacterium]